MCSFFFQCRRIKRSQSDFRDISRSEGQKGEIRSEVRFHHYKSAIQVNGCQMFVFLCGAQAVGVSGELPEGNVPNVIDINKDKHMLSGLLITL